MPGFRGPPPVPPSSPINAGAGSNNSRDRPRAWQGQHTGAVGQAGPDAGELFRRLDSIQSSVATSEIVGRDRGASVFAILPFGGTFPGWTRAGVTAIGRHSTGSAGPVASRRRHEPSTRPPPHAGQLGLARLGIWIVRVLSRPRSHLWTFVWNVERSKIPQPQCATSRGTMATTSRPNRPMIFRRSNVAYLENTPSPSRSRAQP